jgi:hypothetical protein
VRELLIRRGEFETKGQVGYVYHLGSFDSVISQYISHSVDLCNSPHAIVSILFRCSTEVKGEIGVVLV